MLHIAVHRERDRALGEVADFRSRVNRPEHGGTVKALADLPRLLLVTHRALQVAAGHVEAERVTVDVLEGCFRRNIAAARFQRRHQLDLVMIVLGQRGIGMIGDGTDRDVLDRIGRLLEEERRLAVGIGSHFARVRRIVAPDAIDPPHRKHIGLTDNRDGRGANGENRFRAGLGLGGRSGGSARQRQRARCKNSPAIDGIHGVLPVVVLFIVAYEKGPR